MAIRLIRLYTGEDGQSHFEASQIAWQRQDAFNAVSALTAVQEVSFEETAAGSSLDWHNAPCRQYVITLSGRLEFETRDGAVQVVGPLSDRRAAVDMGPFRSADMRRRQLTFHASYPIIPHSPHSADGRE